MADNNEMEQETKLDNEGRFLRKRNLIKSAQDKIGKGYFFLSFLCHCGISKFVLASELLKKKIPYSGHLLAPKSLWLKRVSTPNCDVVIVFPTGIKDSVLLWLLSKLKQSPGLTVHVRHHASTQSSAFYITAPFTM